MKETLLTPVTNYSPQIETETKPVLTTILQLKQ